MCEHAPNIWTRILARIHDARLGDVVFHSRFMPSVVGEVFCWAADRKLGFDCMDCARQRGQR